MERCATYNPSPWPVLVSADGASIGGREFGVVDRDDPVAARALTAGRVLEVRSLPGAVTNEESSEPAPVRPRRKATRKPNAKSGPSSE